MPLYVGASLPQNVVLENSREHLGKYLVIVEKNYIQILAPILTYEVMVVTFMPGTVSL